MQLRATRLDAYQLFQAGTLALADISATGFRIDTELLHHNIQKVSKDIKRIEAQLKEDSVWRRWTKKFGPGANLGSLPQLAQILSTMFPEAWTEEDRTPTGRPKTDEETLSRIDLPFLRVYSRRQKLIKARSTYLNGILRETVDGYLHCSFSLGLVRSYRGSSDSPNFQNMPIRLPWISELIRPCFIARPNCYIGELDFKGIEVGISACYNKDPRLVAYVSNPDLDMHRDMAAEIYQCDKSAVTKEARYTAKNRFVFPEFYGDWYLSCARSLWESVERMKLSLTDGTSMKEHLLSCGISKLGACDPDRRPLPGTFEDHIQKVEDRFWNKRFRVYNQWKKDWWEAYQETGVIKLLTGFEIRGFLKRKEAINYPIQGTAFHCLLWCLIQLHNWIKQKGLQSRILGQIHDSLICDIHKDERDMFLEKARRIMMEDLPARWPWIIVPLSVEVEMSPLNGNWYEKKEVAL